MNSEEEFLKALMALTPVEQEPFEYRFHYDEFGRIYSCSMINHPVGTEYLVVDKETFDNFFKYKVNVKKKKLEKIVFDPNVSVQLKRSNQGFKTVKHHAGLIIEPDETYEDIEYYESNY